MNCRCEVQTSLPRSGRYLKSGAPNQSLPPCGARRTVRAYAVPPILRPLQKSRNAFLCHRQRHCAIPCAAREEPAPDAGTAAAHNGEGGPTPFQIRRAACVSPGCPKHRRTQSRRRAPRAPLRLRLFQFTFLPQKKTSLGMV